MKTALYPLIPLLLLLILQACHDTRGPLEPIEVEQEPIEVDWSHRIYTGSLPDSTETGSTYLSIYSHIYSQNEHRSHDLTATVSIRNINEQDTIILHRAEYFATEGNSLRNYFEEPIYIRPMETVEIIIEQLDREGGSGANFIFDWTVEAGIHEPFFEAIMISGYGNQGLSFRTEGVRIK